MNKLLGEPCFASPWWATQDAQSKLLILDSLENLMLFNKSILLLDVHHHIFNTIWRIMIAGKFSCHCCVSAVDICGHTFFANTDLGV
jgi:hypothetical protein